MHVKKYAWILPVWIVILAFGACGDSGNGTSDIDGQALFKKYCVLCHGEDGRRETNGAKDLTLSVMPLKDRMALIKSGKNLMTPFEGILSPDEIEAVARYSMTFK